MRRFGVAGGATERGRSVASRVTAILMAFRSGGTHSLTELAGLAELPVSTTHRLAGELVARRVLERTEGGGYRVGLPLRMLGGGWVPPPPPLLERTLDVIADLATVTGTVVRAGVLQGSRIAVAEAGSGRPPAAGFTVDPTPPHASALGRVLLAFSPAEVVDDVVAAARATDTSLHPDRLRRVLATTRLARLAVCRTEDRARCSVAVPVFGIGGGLLAALEAAVPDPRSGYEAVRGALLVAAGSLSRELATARSPDEPRSPSAERLLEIRVPLPARRQVSPAQGDLLHP
jgi:DNA-binding IclR family transcriptional regulator